LTYSALAGHFEDFLTGIKNAAASSLAETTARPGHKTVDAALRYQHSQDGGDKIVAAGPSTNALAELAMASRSEAEAG
jgi:hypothetical protein